MWTYPRIIAHRGGGSLAPENTLEAFQCGFNYGFRAVEFDVMLTKDRVPVVVHDEQLGRTVAGAGLIAEIESAALFALDAGSWFDPTLTQVRVPAFRQVLDFCTRNGIWMNIEIKPAAGFEEVTGTVVAETVLGFYQNTNFPLPLFSSFALDALAVAQQVAPQVPRGVLFDRLPANWLKMAQELDVVSVHTNHRNLTAPMSNAIKQAGFGLACYTVNDPDLARELLRWGVDALFTDNIKTIPAHFAESA